MTTYNVVSPGAMVAGQAEDISVILSNFQAIAAILNGNLDNANLAPGAAIVPSKIAGYPASAAVYLRGDGSWAAPPAPPAITYATTFPVTPVDGQEHILVDSITVPTYVWRFRYNAGSTSPYKWEFIGGAPKAAVATANLQGNGTFDSVTNITLPNAGDGWHIINWAGQNSYANSTTSGYSLAGAASQMLFTKTIGLDSDFGGGGSWINWLAQAAATVMKIRMVSTNNNNMRTLTHSILPVRVS
jgi:hypothetical protein